MKYNKENRVQHENYSSVYEFVTDAIETLQDLDNHEDVVNIVADKQIMDEILAVIGENNVKDFKFETPTPDSNVMEIDELYTTSIYSDGEAYLENAINPSYDDYYNYDGFMFVHKEVDSDIYQYSNRNCDVIVFDINGL